MKATATPWTLDGWAIRAEAAENENVGNAGGMIAALCTGFENTYEAAANGEKIVRAVNNFDTLMRALQDIKTYKDEPGGPPPDDAMRAIAEKALEDMLK